MIKRFLLSGLLVLAIIIVGGCGSKNDLDNSSKNEGKTTNVPTKEQGSKSDLSEAIKSSDNSVTDIKISQPSSETVKTEIVVNKDITSAQSSQLVEKALEDAKAEYPDKEISITIKDEQGNIIGGASALPNQ